MLTSTREHYVSQQRLTAAAVVEARRRATRGAQPLARIVASYQVAAISLTLASTPNELAEQGISAPPAARVAPAALLTPPPAAIDMLSKAANQQALDRLVATLVQDAGRTASAVDMARRPAVTGYVRSLNPPSCSRCAVLAGRVYRYSTGFQRHPLCDCIMTMTTDDLGLDLVIDPTVMVERGQVRGLSKADQEAVSLGADLGQVVNVRSRGAGLSIAGSVLVRTGRPTPAGILRTAADDRVEAVRLLRTHGYLT